jgi:hypothetical protein
MGADRPMGADRRGLVSLFATALIAGGCVGGSSLDFGTPVNLHISTTPTSVELDAPGWFANVAAVYLCPSEPARLPDSPADRVDWTPGAACEFMGSYPSRDGLTLSLPLSGLKPERRPAFDAAADWYLVLMNLDGNRVGSAISSRFHAPPRASAS